MKVPIGEHRVLNKRGHGDKTTHYMDRRIIRILDQAKRAPKFDEDIVFIVDGRVGVGKSTLATQCASYLDPNMTINNIKFTLKQWITFTKQVKECSVQYDEAFVGGMDSKSALSKINKESRKLLSQIRYKHLFTFICMPSFFDLDVFIPWRANGLFHIIKLPNRRRKWYYWSHRKLIKLYYHGKKHYYSYKKVPPTLSGTFSKYFPFDKEEYQKNKIYALEHAE